ncbi:MAG TPA: spore coat protein CotJB [Firmicutes bacterium]|nr:spore coat protein CotJB [Bacillota bacterium]
MDPKHQALLRIMELEFTAIDLNLFLDTHPGDQRALGDYNATVQELMAAKMAYESRYGPILNYGLSPSPQAWRWIEEPWPWEITFRAED